MVCLLCCLITKQHGTTWIGCVERFNSVMGKAWTITYCFRSSSTSNTRWNHIPREKQYLSKRYRVVTLWISLMLLTTPQRTWQFHCSFLMRKHRRVTYRMTFRVLLWIITELICGVCAGVSSTQLCLILCDTLISGLNIPVLISVGFGFILKLPIKNLIHPKAKLWFPRGFWGRWTNGTLKTKLGRIERLFTYTINHYDWLGFERLKKGKRGPSYQQSFPAFECFLDEFLILERWQCCFEWIGQVYMVIATDGHQPACFLPTLRGFKTVQSWMRVSWRWKEPM